MDLLRWEKLIRKTQSFRLTERGPWFQQFIKITFWILGISAILLLFVRWQQTAQGYGRVIAFLPSERVQELTTPLSGQIEKWYVTEGELVTQGQTLADIADNDPDILLRLQSEKEAAEKRLKVAEINVRNQEINLKRQQELVTEGIVSQRQVELAEMDLAAAISARASAQMELNRILVRLSQQSRQKIQAPFTGTAQKILVAEKSKFLKAGDPIAWLTPQTEERIVEAWIRGRDLPFVKVGQFVRLQFDGWPIFQISGLPELSVGTFKGRVRLIDPSDDGKGYFRVLVEPSEDAIWPSARLLRQGIKAQVWIAMNRVPLWFEIWRNLFSLPPMPVPIFDELETLEKKKSDK